MARVLILAGEADENIGIFETDHLPRAGEIVTVPWTTDPYGNRIFTIVEVNHVAVGSPSHWGDGPLTILRYSEEIT